MVASVKGFGKKVKTFTAPKIGDDRKLVADLAAELESYEAWVSFYGKGFDLKMLRSKLLWYGMEDIELKPHIDMFFVLKFATNTARRSQAHYLRWLEIHQQKMDLSPAVWAQMAADPKKHMKTLVARCESDVAGLEALYSRTRNVIKDLKR